MLSQIPGAETALDAASHKSYESVLTCIVVLACIGLVTILLRWFIRSMDERLRESAMREAAMSLRLKELETFVHTTLLGIVERNNTVMQELTAALRDRPCLVDHPHQHRQANP
jgi:hypothetical protein